MPTESADGSHAREPDIYRVYRKSLLSPERVRELSRLRPARVVWDTLGCWAVIVLAWACVAYHPAWWVVLLAIPVIGTRSYALMILAHDGFHRRLFEGVRANDLFNDLCITGSFGVITRINNRNHLAHHQLLAQERDPDRYKYTCINKNSGWTLARYLVGGQVLVSIYNVLVRRGGGAAAVRERGARPGYVARDLSILLGWQAVLWTMGIWWVGWWAVPVLWYFPFFAFALLADNFRTFAEHTRTEPDAVADGHRIITYTPCWLERVFFSPMHMNYHAVHHLWTSIPYYNLREADTEIRAMPGAAGLEWRKSYLGFLWRYWRAVPIAGCETSEQGGGRG